MTDADDEPTDADLAEHIDEMHQAQSPDLPRAVEAGMTGRPPMEVSRMTVEDVKVLTADEWRDTYEVVRRMRSAMVTHPTACEDATMRYAADLARTWLERHPQPTSAPRQAPAGEASESEAAGAAEPGEGGGGP